MTRRSTTRAERILPLACGGALASIILLIVGRDYPLVGHDLRYYIPRLLDTDLHIRLNGMSVQWYTPTFGGGLPAYANPQHLQHSVLQALTYVVNPWLAISITTAIVSIAGFDAFYRFLLRQLQLHVLPSVLGATFFIANGFYINHTIVGHVGFQLFPLSAIVLGALTDQRRPALRNACIIALVLAAMLFQASGYLIVLVALSLALTLPVLFLLDARLVVLRRVTIVSAAGFVLFVLIAVSKLYASFALMRQFPREIADVYDAGVLQGLAGLGAQLVGAVPLVPVFAILQLDLTRIGGLLGKLVGATARIGVWELDIGLSPVQIAILCIAAVRIAVWFRRDGTPNLARPQVIALMALCVTTWIVIEATLAKGLIYPHIKNLPILRSMHVNARIASVFIIPLSILAAVVVNVWYSRTRNGTYLIAAIVAAMVAPLTYLALPARVHDRSFDVTRSVEDSRHIRAGHRFTVEFIADVSDADAVSKRASSYRPYEPLFGYALEEFAVETQPGPIRGVRDGYFNMTNPASLVFPELNGLRPFERISAADEAALDAFVNRRQPDWRLPPILRVLNWVAVATFCVTLLGIAWR